MKKIFKTLVVASVLLSGLVFTSCGYLLEKDKEGNEDLTLKDYIINQKLQKTEKIWFQYQGDVPDIPIGATDNSKDDPSTGKLENAELYFYFDRNEGLKVAVQAETTQQVGLFGGAITTDMKLVTGSVHVYEDFTVAKWITLTELSAMKESEEPKVSSNPDECLIIGGDEANSITVQWKRVLAEIILSKLLKLDE